MADEEEVSSDDVSRAEAVAKRAMELAARAEELARQAHEVAGVDDQLAALEAELASLSDEEESLDAGIDAGPSEPGQSDDGVNDWAEMFSERMEQLGYRLGELVSGSVEAAMSSSFGGFTRPFPGSEAFDPTHGSAVIPVVAPIPVVVTTGGGSVRVGPGPADEVRVHWRTRGRSHRYSGEPGVTVEERDGAIYVETPRRFGWWPKVSRIEVEVPRTSPVEISTGGGSVRVEGTNGPVRARTGGGSVRVEDADGEASVTTGGGGIKVRGRLSGDSSIRTGGGSVTVELVEGTHIEVDASGSSVSTDIPGLVVKNGRCTGVVGDGSSGRLRVSTGGGSTKIRRG
jgi:hypothetical protein